MCVQKIYIVLTYTGTILSKAVKLYTRKKYSHISLALDKELKEMYSFGRLNPYNPFIGGFVHESIDSGTFKRFKNTTTRIYSLVVTDEQYERLKNKIREVAENKNSYKFNILGLIAVMFNINLNRYKCFYCAEFVKYLLDSSNIDIGLPEAIKPEDFYNISGSEDIYIGKLREYKV